MNVTGIEDQNIAMYAKGISTRDIQDHLYQLYGIEVSQTRISNVTNKIVPIIKEWQNRPLQSVYAVVFMDAIHYKVTKGKSIFPPDEALQKMLYLATQDVIRKWTGRV